jgi:hypothetical protein
LAGFVDLGHTRDPVVRLVVAVDRKGSLSVEESVCNECGDNPD